MTATLELREHFYSETNNELKLLQDWEPYAKWLEQLAIKRINKEIMAENRHLREAFFDARDLLECALTKRIDVEVND